MKKSLLTIVFSIFLLLQVIAQKEGYTWYFGEFAGMDFNINQTPRPLTNNTVMDQLEGCTTISDPTGQMLFFSDGQTVWNSIFEQMPNGNNLMGGRSSTQSAIIVPYPGNIYQYYIFTIDSENGDHGLRYSIVDMRLDNGLGDIRWDKKNQMLYQNVTEKLSAVINSDFTSYWIITHEANSRQFVSFKLTPEGISTDPHISTGIINHTHKVGYMKFSPDGLRVACAIKGLNLIEIYNFDKSSGLITGNHPISITNIPGAYGIEFSPDCSKLFVSWEEYMHGRIYQFDLTAGDGSQIPVANSKKIVGFDYQFLFGALQLGPDGKIYITKFISDQTGHSLLDVLNNPDSYTDCAFTHNTCNLNGRESKAGLPNFVQSFFMPKRFVYDEFCLGIPTSFEIPDRTNIDQVEWTFDDPNSGQNYSTSFTPVHVFSSVGNFNVQLIVYQDGIQKEYIQTVKIYPRPEVHLGSDTTICHPITLDAGPDAMRYLWSNGETTQTIEVHESNQDQIFWIRIEDFICWDADTILVKACQPCDVFLPNAFSPNSDGHNDFLTILGGNYSNFEMIIYNNSGQEVFRSSDVSRTWDGISNGQKLEIGVYVYTLFAKCIEGTVIQKTGNITLLR